MKNCRFCGGKVLEDASTCKHCGKTLEAGASNSAGGLTNLDSWEKKAIPTWVMAVVVLMFLGVVGFMVVKGCEQKRVNQEPLAPVPRQTNLESRSEDFELKQTVYAWYSSSAILRAGTGTGQSFPALSGQQPYG